MGEAVEFFHTNGFLSSKFDHTTKALINGNCNGNHKDIDSSGSWYEETIDDDLKWSFALNGFVNFFMKSFFNPNFSLLLYIV